MAALTAERDTVEVAERAPMILIPVKAGVTIWQGALVAIDETGYAVPAKKEEGLTAAGRAECTVDNSAGEDGNLEITVRRGCFKWENSGSDAVDATCLLKDCYIEDDQTVAKTETGTSVAGKVLAVTETGIWVETW